MSSLNPNQRISLPSHSQWGVLNSLKHQQYQQALRVQKIVEHQKKQIFRSQLDKQMQRKSHNSMYQKQADRSYHQFIVNKTRIQQDKQKQQKLNKYYLRRSMEFQNQKHLQEERDMTNSQIIEAGKNQNKFLIGYRDQSNSKFQEEKRKNQILSQLNQQVRLKYEQKRNQRIKEIKDFYDDLRYQDSMTKSQQFNRRKFKQNQEVYKYYSNIHQEKQEEQKKLQEAIVDRPIYSKMQYEQYLDRQKSQRQKLNKKQIKDALDQQVNRHKIQLAKQKQIKPQQISYSYFGEMFNPDSKGYGKYDKKQYQNYLQRQMQLQKINKKKLEYMDEQQYLLNLNQINKALNGEYLNKSYHDNSIANVGETLNRDINKSQNMRRSINASSINNTGENPESSVDKVKAIKNKDQNILRGNLEELLKKHSIPNNMSRNQQMGNSLGSRTKQQQRIY